MKLALRVLAIFFVALLLADQVSTALLNMARRQHLAHLDHGAWWPGFYAAQEVWEFFVYALLFGLLGVIFSLLIRSRNLAVTLAGLLGLGFAVVAFAVEPDLPFVRYSHAPAWLWLLSWSVFYVPAIACTLGAILAGKVSNHARPAPNAA